MNRSIDPATLLNALEPVLSRNGSLRCRAVAGRFLNIMRACRRLVPRCVYMNILKATTENPIRDQILDLGLWRTLSQWLGEAYESNNYPFLIELIGYLHALPLKRQDIESNCSLKIVHSLSEKTEIPKELHQLAVDVSASWQALCSSDQGMPEFRISERWEPVLNTVVDREASRKHNSPPVRSVEPARHTPAAAVPVCFPRMVNTVADPNIDVEESDDSPNTNGSHSDSPMSDQLTMVTFVPLPADKKESIHKIKKEPVSTTRVGADSSSKLKHAKYKEVPVPAKYGPKSSLQKSVKADQKIADVNKVATKGAEHVAALKRPYAQTVLKGKESEPPPVSRPAEEPAAADANKPQQKVRRGRTAKTYPTQFRSTGLEQEVTLLPKRQKQSGGINRDDAKRMNADTLVSGFSTSVSNAFDQMASVDRSMLPAVNSSSVSVIVPSAAKIAKLSDPSVSFESPVRTKPAPKPAHLVESDSFMAALEVKVPQKPVVFKRKKVLPKPVQQNGTVLLPSTSAAQRDFASSLSTPAEQGKNSSSEDVSGLIGSLSSSTARSSSTGALVSSVGSDGKWKAKRGGEKRHVQWASDLNLVQVHYFEMEDGERVNVNRIRPYGDLKHFEMHREREALEAARRTGGLSSRPESEVKVLMNWKLVPIDCPPLPVVPGSASQERLVQERHQQNVLAELYFSPQLIPDSPKEPDFVERVNNNDVKLIPLEESPISLASLAQKIMPGVQPDTLPPELTQLLQGLNKTAGQPVGPQMTGTPAPGSQVMPTVNPATGNGAGRRGMMGSGTAVPYGMCPPMNVQMMPSSAENMPLPGMDPSMMARGNRPCGMPPVMYNGPAPSPMMGGGGRMPGNWNAVPPGAGQGLLGNAPPPFVPGGGRPRFMPPAQSYRHPSPRNRQRLPHGVDSSKPCHYFLQGRCNYGDRCYYAHVKPGPVSSPSPSSTAPIPPAMPTATPSTVASRKGSTSEPAEDSATSEIQFVV